MMVEIDDIDYDADTVKIHPSGEVLPITNWLSPSGEDQKDCYGATALVAGPMRSEGWFSSQVYPVFRSKAEAIAFAVKNSHGGVVYVFGRDGRIAERIVGRQQ